MVPVLGILSRNVDGLEHISVRRTMRIMLLSNIGGKAQWKRKTDSTFRGAKVYHSIVEGRVRVGAMGGAKKEKDEDSEIYSYNSFIHRLKNTAR